MSPLSPTLVLSIVSVATGAVTVIGAVEELSAGSVSGVGDGERGGVLVAAGYRVGQGDAVDLDAPARVARREHGEITERALQVAAAEGAVRAVMSMTSGSSPGRMRRTWLRKKSVIVEVSTSTTSRAIDGPSLRTSMKYPVGVPAGAADGDGEPELTAGPANRCCLPPSSGRLR